MSMPRETTISISAFKAKALNLIDEISRSGKELVVTRHGKALAKVVPYVTTPKKSLPGQLKHTLLFEKDLVSPLGNGLWNAAR